MEVEAGFPTVLTPEIILLQGRVGNMSMEFQVVDRSLKAKRELIALFQVVSFEVERIAIVIAIKIFEGGFGELPVLVAFLPVIHPSV